MRTKGNIPFVFQASGFKLQIPNNRTTGSIDIGKKTNIIIRMIGSVSTVWMIYILSKSAINIYSLAKRLKSSHTKQSDPQKSVPAIDTPPSPIAVTLAEQLKKCHEKAVDREFLGYTFLLKGTRNILYGSKKSFKSTLATSLAKSVATGKDLGLSLNLQGHNRTGAIHVDIYDAEHSAEDFIERYENKDIPNLNFITQFSFPSYKDYVSAIRKRAFEVKQDMLVIGDNSTKMFGNLSANDCNDFDSKLKALQADAKAEGFTLTILTLMHSGKDANRGPMGTSNYENFSENVFAIEKKSSGSAILTFKACRHYEDNVSYFLDCDINKFALTYNPEETAKLCNKGSIDEGEDGESPVNASLMTPDQMTQEQIKELIQFYKSSPKNGYGTCFKKFGHKFGFKSKSTMTRYIKNKLQNSKFNR